MASPTRHPTDAPGAAPPRAAQVVTPRAIVLGGLLAAASAAAAPYLSFRMGVWLPGSDSLMTTPVLALLALVCANSVLLWRRPSRAFSRGELLTIYAMLIVSLGWLT